MNSDRIKEIQEGTAYPESVSVMLALKQVWNECEQEQVKKCNKHGVMASLPDISLMQAESIVLEKQSAIDVDCKIDHTEIGLLFMEGYYYAKRKLEGNEP